MYDYIESLGADSPYFYFRTSNNLTYSVSFRPMPNENYPFHNLYAFDFTEIDNKKSSKDDLIPKTILKIVDEFLKKDSSIILHYVCDSTDNKQLFRRRLFNRWFLSCKTVDWIKYDYDFEEVPYYISFIYSTNDYDTELIEREVLLSLDSYERMKRD
ncbi:MULTISPECIES: DUF6169 family protein [unclassified Tenacibaculum]|uniref:DUF6169 family protein n=1 Tax=unclassified Tenacibaculum TaxID=2635139 RepID=UPI001F37D6C4|nr:MULTISPECIES: DUF6169 family protein [unclassified Tenacibaculum]MCF2875392.1 DUF6169 family protein [Tenacibaculum sp. Cn5-1]MCF2935468.1 DUF6169 family protein [Tenacibaculum sp. Cn5-34]MCG7512028.1 DUF6169 family protein [Tenacibaculum sp. Cn5-46]